MGDIYGGSYTTLGLPSAMIASSFGKLKSKAMIEKINKNDIARSLLTMLTVNTLTLSRLIMQKEKIKNVIWIGTHIDMLEYMQMCHDAFNYLSNGEMRLIIPTYHSFLGSLGLLISNYDLTKHDCSSESELSMDYDEEEKKSESPGDRKQSRSDSLSVNEPSLKLFGRQYSLTTEDSLMQALKDNKNVKSDKIIDD